MHWLTTNNKINLSNCIYSSSFNVDQLFHSCQTVIRLIKRETNKKGNCHISIGLHDSCFRSCLNKKLIQITPDTVIRRTSVIPIADFIRGRKIRVRINVVTSKEQLTWVGVLQGSVLNHYCFFCTSTTFTCTSQKIQK